MTTDRPSDDSDDVADGGDDVAEELDDTAEDGKEPADASDETEDDEGPADALDEADIDWEMAPDSDAEFPADPETREFLREVAADVRGDSSESKQVAAILYRVSDLYDPTEDTSPEEIYLNVRHIMQIKAQGGIER